MMPYENECCPEYQVSASGSFPLCDCSDASYALVILVFVFYSEYRDQREQQQMGIMLTDNLSEPIQSG